jgi:hypothetical protein
MLIEIKIPKLSQKMYKSFRVRKNMENTTAMGM